MSFSIIQDFASIDVDAQQLDLEQSIPSYNNFKWVWLPS